jgi:serine/threonine-protein kinase HipA
VSALAGLETLTQVDVADVLKAGRLAARLERTPTGVQFRYTDPWIGEGGAPVSSTLPVTPEPVVTTGGAVPAYFAGLLPEGRRLSALRRGVKTSADDELTLVMAVGADAIGDVQVVPAGRPPAQVEPRLEVTDFGSVRFRELLDELEIRVDRVGLPGVQDKASLAMLNLPVAAAHDRFLLKLNPPEYRHVVENEAFFLAAARSSGLETVDAQLVRDVDGEAGLVVRRFDRVTSHGTVESLAVEDGCQALGLHPEGKYRVTTETVLARLCSLCEAPLPAARTFLAQMVFAYVSGNGDAHAKNFSVLQDRTGRWAPAPAYDVPSSQPYGDNTLALSVDGRRDGNIPRSSWVALGVHLGLPERAAERTVDRVATAVDRWVDGLDRLPFDPGRITKLAKVVRSRQQKLLRGY